jgi:methylmalonyl-CoA mutase N-terminal domain/subunit
MFRRLIIASITSERLGADVVQGIAFCLANAVAYMDELTRRGIDVNHFPRPWINITAGTDFFEEICKFRAFRRIWARIMKERFGAQDPRSMMLTREGEPPQQEGAHPSALPFAMPEYFSFTKV